MNSIKEPAAVVLPSRQEPLREGEVEVTSSKEGKVYSVENIATECRNIIEKEGVEKVAFAFAKVLCGALSVSLLFSDDKNLRTTEKVLAFSIVAYSLSKEIENREWLKGVSSVGQFLSKGAGLYKFIT